MCGAASTSARHFAHVGQSSMRRCNDVCSGQPQNGAGENHDRNRGKRDGGPSAVRWRLKISGAGNITKR